MKSVTSRYLLTICAACSFCLTARAATWTSIPAGSTLEFIAGYEGTEAPGRFEQFKVELVFDPEQSAGASMRVEVVTASARLGNEELDEAVAGPEWFDVQNYPLAVFTSNSILHPGGADYIAEGIVSIKGLSKPIKVPLRWTDDSHHAEIAGELVLSRLDFAIGTGEWARDQTISFDVRVRFRVELEPKP